MPALTAGSTDFCSVSAGAVTVNWATLLDTGIGVSRQ